MSRDDVQNSRKSVCDRLDGGGEGMSLLDWWKEKEGAGRRGST